MSDAVDPPNQSSSVVFWQDMLRRRVVFRDFLDASRIRDAVPAMTVDLRIHGLVVRSESGFGDSQTCS